jgi:hypothetical protein
MVMRGESRAEVYFILHPGVVGWDVVGGVGN